MKFIHLSDLHIGKRVNEFPMLEEQRYILSEILRIIDERHVDGVIIAGDIYDKAVPPAEAVVLFDDFLTRLYLRGHKVFIIGGNHDQTERLSFGSALMREEGVYLSRTFCGNICPVTVEDGFGEIDVYLLPFVRPANVRPFFPESEIASYNDAIKTVIDNMSVREGVRSILVAHQFVTGALPCGSEEMSVGGLDNVDVSVFDKFDYVALGHIHGSQFIGRETVRYCGAPLKYSFSEVEHIKSALIVTLAEKGNISFEKIPLKPLRDFREIKGSYMELSDRGFYEGTDVNDFLHIILTDENDIADAIGRLRSIYPNIMRLDYDNSRSRQNNAAAALNTEEKRPAELLADFYRLQNNREMSKEQRLFAEKLIDRIWGENP